MNTSGSSTGNEEVKVWYTPPLDLIFHTWEFGPLIASILEVRDEATIFVRWHMCTFPARNRFQRKTINQVGDVINNLYLSMDTLQVQVSR